MADKVAEKERVKYERMWEFDSYRERSPGTRFIDNALALLKPKNGASFIDLGCGTGRVSNFLKWKCGFDVTAVDIAENACKEFDGRFVVANLWELPEDLGIFDYGFCADVMEHIPTDKVPDTLKCIANHTKQCYFQIANFHCHEGDKIGEHLHLTVKSVNWWRSALNRHFNKVSIRADKKHHIAVCNSHLY